VPEAGIVVAAVTLAPVVGKPIDEAGTVMPASCAQLRAAVGGGELLLSLSSLPPQPLSNAMMNSGAMIAAAWDRPFPRRMSFTRMFSSPGSGRACFTVM
jgi:hypothetical protein